MPENCIRNLCTSPLCIFQGKQEFFKILSAVSERNQLERQAEWIRLFDDVNVIKML